MASNISAGPTEGKSSPQPPELTDFVSMDRDTLMKVAKSRKIVVWEHPKLEQLITTLVEDETFDWKAAKHFPEKDVDPSQTAELLSINSFGQDQMAEARIQSQRAVGDIGRNLIKFGKKNMATADSEIKKGQAKVDLERDAVDLYESSTRS